MKYTTQANSKHSLSVMTLPGGSHACKLLWGMPASQMIKAAEMLTKVLG